MSESELSIQLVSDFRLLYVVEENTPLFQCSPAKKRMKNANVIDVKIHPSQRHHYAETGTTTSTLLGKILGRASHDSMVNPKRTVTSRSLVKRVLS